MSDRMRQIPFGQLMTWVLGEFERDGTVFGISKHYACSPDGCGEFLGRKLELPFGPAAGPHTQLAQNLVASYVAGARFFELKTVQALDGEDLPVSKPCIDAADEGYNVEWSTELYVPQALDEYIKGWFAIKLLSRELGLGSADGFMFNMSVGYDIEGIKSQKIDRFIEGLKNAESTDSWKTCRQWAMENLPRFKRVDKAFVESIRPNISDSITLSTLHGCPPEEIERIAEYLLREKKLHTFIKCNPTLLGFEYAREALNRLGYGYISFDDRHFKHDLQLEDAVPILKRLQSLASSLSLGFGVKLTNTFPVQILNSELPGEEMYMSGRALFPLSVEVARKLSSAFDGKLSISYSGGADARNIAEIIGTGIRPVTLATTLLKPGGYERLHQVATILGGTDPAQAERGSSCIELEKLAVLSRGVFERAMYKKQPGLPPSRKIGKTLPMLDCFTAPCRSGCPFGQDVPAYLSLMSRGKQLEALRVIAEKNPLMHITGTICSHNCMDKCMRNYVDESVDIRGAKLAAAGGAFGQLLAEVKSSASAAKTGAKVAVIGGGPAGLAAAYFLARANCRVTLFEERNSLGGVVRHVIPQFRIDDGAIARDIELVAAMGIDVRLGSKVTDIGKLCAEGFEYVIAAIGAWKANTLKLQEGSAIDALKFLEEQKKGLPAAALGEHVVVVGGGNTAMDTARAAKRAEGVRKVTLVYRRTRRYMPAAPEEIELAQSDGIEIVELAAPVKLSDSMLTCELMQLGEPDSSGRRGFSPSGETISIKCDTLISAIGNLVDSSLFEGQDVHVIGDAARGPATVAEAIADAMRCAADIAGIDFDKYDGMNINPPAVEVERKRGVLCLEDCACGEPEHCLECATVCKVCAEVCPNRANINVRMDDGRVQIVHVDSMCNECGNCAVFCPYDGAPYLDKFTFFNSEHDFAGSKNPGFVKIEDGGVRVRLDGNVSEHRDKAQLPRDICVLIERMDEQYAALTEWCATP